jgi:hypothetical protein
MCFSAEASFTVGAVLVPAGVYCLQAAARKQPRLLPLAVVPVIFGLQQISEGFVWLGLARQDALLTRRAALVFLLPAMAGWPFWIPFLTWVKETHPFRKRILLLLTGCSTAWFWFLYVPLLVGPETLLTAQIHHHSIDYKLGDIPVSRHLQPGLVQFLYLLTVGAPFLIGSEKWGLVPTFLLTISALAASILFQHAFVSVWCFFAAGLAVFLVSVFYRLPQRPGFSTLPALAAEGDKVINPGASIVSPQQKL